jgi:large subunit ribosomal protein L10
MSKVLKKTINEDLQRRLGQLESYLLVDFRGLNSAQSYDLRRSLLDVGVRMNVVPNRMALRILDRWSGKSEGFRGFFRGPTAILHGGDAGALTASRAAMQWKKKNKNLLPIKGAVLEGEVLGTEAAEGLAKIPDRPQLLARVAGCLNAPLVRLATVTQGPLANLARVLDAHRKKLEEGAPKASEAEAPAAPASEAPAAPAAEAPAAPAAEAPAAPAAEAPAAPAEGGA